MQDQAGKISVNVGRLQARIDTMAAMTRADRPWERTAFSALHHDARAYLTQEMREVGLETRIDAAGNLIGRMPGAHNERAPIAIGSHSDTVPRGGRFDGVAGVMVALEIAETLQEAGHRTRHPIEIIDFLAEEPNRYGISCVGSRGMVGALTQDMLGLVAPDGSTLADGIRQMGGDPEKLRVPLRKAGDLSAFLELHIEQARVLEATGDDIGIVTGIVGIARIEIKIDGVADHAGATPMALRHDALAGAAEMILAAEARARTETRCDMVATVGKLDLSPNASNAVPGSVTFTLELRASDAAVLLESIDWADRHFSALATARSLGFAASPVGQSTPVAMNDAVQATLCNAAKAQGYRSRSMPSGAGHDAAYMAQIAPTGMVFIPCLHGRSHCPEEYASPDQIAKGAQTLLTAVLSLDEMLN